MTLLVVGGSEPLVQRLRLLAQSEGVGIRLVPDAATAQAAVAGFRPRLIVAEGMDAGHRRDLSCRCGWVPVIPAEPGTEIQRTVAACLAGDEAVALKVALATARLLVVDDSVTYREYMRLELERAGCAVNATADPDHALAQLGSGTIDGVLLDLVMPRVDGLELTRRAARLRRETGCPFLIAVLSSRESGSDLASSFDAGADLFLRKSQDVALLLAELGACLRSMRAMAVALGG